MVNFYISTLKRITLLILVSLFTACTTYDADLRDTAGNTLLHYAVFSGDIIKVKKIIKSGADVNLSNNYGLTPLRCAAALNNREIMEILLKNGACTNYQSPAAKGTAGRGVKKNIIRHPEERLNFFLTFDTGSDDANLDYILATLKKYRIVATFFTTGEFMEKYPDGIKRIVREGHVVGNHTFTHNMNYPDGDTLLNELYATELLFKKITGREMTRIWRAPGLQHIYNPRVITEAEKLGYRHIDVNLGTVDWVEQGNPEYISNEKFLELFKSHLNMKGNSHAIINRWNYWSYYTSKPDYHGTIMLMHAGSFRKDGKDFVFTLDEVIMYLISAGYSFDNCRRFEYTE
ncbi:MAG TPA: polysaccharide deacetylase family protein [Spirochaetota bacterium]|nr:polysaccharide deacetylase family protein [Spirochaetota bacterium]HRX48017.1 polysaccharide deacetylase family protein [Spirochaetota bacterium]